MHTYRGACKANVHIHTHKHFYTRMYAHTCMQTHRQPLTHVPVSLISDLKVLACVAPVVGCGVAVAHPHEALGAQHCMYVRVNRGVCACVCFLCMYVYVRCSNF